MVIVIHKVIVTNHISAEQLLVFHIVQLHGVSILQLMLFNIGLLVHLAALLFVPLLDYLIHFTPIIVTCFKYSTHEWCMAQRLLVPLPMFDALSV